MTSTAANQDKTDKRAPNVWPCLAYTDARGAIRFLVGTLGFTESACYGEGDTVDHAELTWPYGGGIMLGSAGRDTPLDQHATRAPSTSSFPRLRSPTPLREGPRLCRDHHRGDARRGLRLTRLHVPRPAGSVLEHRHLCGARVRSVNA